MNILVIAPHMDDEVIGCGGTIARHVELADDVTVCVVANRAYDHVYEEVKIAHEKAATREARDVLGYQGLEFLDLPDERLDASLQDIIVPLEEVYRRVAPEVVYVCHRGDLNQDHRAVFFAAMVVVRPQSGRKPRVVLSYEVPSSTDQAFPLAEFAFQPNYYVDISEHLQTKVTALACYDRESRQYPNPRSSDGLRVCAQKRGTEVGLDAAEAFVILRSEWPRGTERPGW